MMKMPHNPNNWPDWLELFHRWWRGETPLGAVVLASVMAALRIAYTGGGWKEMLLEGLLCGALTLTVYSALDYFTVPQSLAVAIGGGIGFIGVKQFHTLVMRVLNTRLGGSNDTK